MTVLRPGIIVGDSATGEIDKLDGPYYLMVLIATNDSGLRLPLLGRGDAPLHLVPIDYVIDAAWHIGRHELSAGRTFHIVDPAPLTAREVFERVAEHAHTEKPRGHIPRPSRARCCARRAWPASAAARSPSSTCSTTPSTTTRPTPPRRSPARRSPVPPSPTTSRPRPLRPRRLAAAAPHLRRARPFGEPGGDDTADPLD